MPRAESGLAPPQQGGNHQRDIRRREPVRFDVRHKRCPEHEQGQRKPEGQQPKPPRILVFEPAAQAPPQARRNNQGDGKQEADLPPRQLQNPARCQGMLCESRLRLKQERCPLMIRVPEHDRAEDRRRHKRQPRADTFQLPAHQGIKQKYHNPAKAEENGRVLAEQSATSGKTGRQPPAWLCRLTRVPQAP